MFLLGYLDVDLYDGYTGHKPRLMMGSLLVTGPDAFDTKYRANGSLRYPTSTALMRDTAASVSVP